jgi:hypothetical protein
MVIGKKVIPVPEKAAGVRVIGRMRLGWSDDRKK